MKFANSYTVFELGSEQSEKLNFNNYTIVLNNIPFFSSSLYGLFNILSIELLNAKYHPNQFQFFDNKNEANTETISKDLFIRAPNVVVY